MFAKATANVYEGDEPLASKIQYRMANLANCERCVQLIIKKSPFFDDYGVFDLRAFQA